MPLFLESPFAYRMTKWPRGYPGDFETVEHMVWGIPQVDRENPGYFIECCLLDFPTCHQHRNKLEFQADAVRRAVATSTGITTRVASFGCGGALDLDLVEDMHNRLEVLLVDTDEDALSLAKDRLVGAESLKVHQGDALKVLRSQKDGFDLILFGGLFDYLSDRYITHVLRLSKGLLKRKDSAVVFTNIAARNPFGPLMECAANWSLIERTERRILDLCIEAGFSKQGVNIRKDRTGLTYLVDVVG